MEPAGRPGVVESANYFMEQVEEKPIITKPPDVVLTEEQQIAIDNIAKWLEDPCKQEYKLGGYAGTGKTTVIKSVIKKLDEIDIAVSALTGKAVNVLQRKSVHAQTLHSLIYDCEMQNKKLVFVKKRKPDVKRDLIIVDEASMLSTELYNDLKSFGIKLLFVGDPGQLEPVGDNPNLMLFPDYILSKIHRQAEKSPIIYWANEIRQGRGMNYVGDGTDLVIRDKNIKTSDFFAVDQLICAKNKTREHMNSMVRRAKYLEPNTLVQNEKIIVLRNNIQEGVFNGMILFVDKIIKEDVVGKYTKHKVWICDCVDEIGTPYEIPIWQVPFLTPEKLGTGKDVFVPREVVYCTYGYVITCHKSQGSEWDKLIVFDEWMPPQVWDMKRWRYTAITRAAKQLTYCM